MMRERRFVRREDWLVMVRMKVGLDDIRRWTNLPCWDSLVVTCSGLCCQCLRRKRSPIRHSIAVSEHSVLPLLQGPAVAVL